MAETSSGKISRRQFLKLAGATAAVVMIDKALGPILPKEPPKGNKLQPVTPVPRVDTQPIANLLQAPEIKINPRLIDELATYLTAGRAIIEPAKSAKAQWDVNQRNEILYRERAEEILKFLTVLGPEVDIIKPRLAKMARFTDFGKTPPPQPPKDLVYNPEDSTRLPQDHFVSGHFGPQEFVNVSHNRLVGINAALFLALGLAENEKKNTPFSRAFSASWQERWDWLNAHLGRDILRWVTGIIDSREFIFGRNSRGDVFPTEDTLYSNNLSDRLVVMFGSCIMTLRGYRTTRWDYDRIKDFATVDASGNVDWAFLNQWNSSDKLLQAKVRQGYSDINKFCSRHGEFGWAISKSMV